MDSTTSIAQIRLSMGHTLLFIVQPHYMNIVRLVFALCMILPYMAIGTMYMYVCTLYLLGLVV